MAILNIAIQKESFKIIETIKSEKSQVSSLSAGFLERKMVTKRRRRVFRSLWDRSSRMPLIVSRSEVKVGSQQLMMATRMFSSNLAWNFVQLVKVRAMMFWIGELWGLPIRWMDSLEGHMDREIRLMIY